MDKEKYFTFILDKNNNPHITKRDYILEHILTQLYILVERIDELDENSNQSFKELEYALAEIIDEKKNHDLIKDYDSKVQF